MVVETGGTPLYRQIQADLRERVATGELRPGSQVETEQELMARYGVSRATVRQALSGLVAEGLLEIRRGRGTYVHGAALEHRLGGFYTFSREIERHGMTPSTRVRDIGVVPADDTVADGLGLARGTPVVALSRVRLADDEPIVTETSYLPAARFKGLEEVDFSSASLYETLTSTYGVRPVRARETFVPVLLDREDAAVLGGEPGDPVLAVERTTYDAEGVIIEFCQSILRADRYRYSVELRDV
ncbi:MAG: GntR family transcriptional regulator [Chloroflexota bacterium]|jgi:GntR family transcriptional regulator